MFRNKKGIALEEVIIFGLVSFIFIFGVIPFSARLYKTFNSNQDDSSTANFEDQLILKVQELLKSDKKLDYRQINYFLGDDRVVMGYNAEWNKDESGAAELVVPKPKSCGSEACLCIYKGSRTVFGGDPLKPCAKFDKVKYFVKHKSLSSRPFKDTIIAGGAFYGPESGFDGYEYKYLVLDGNNFKSQTLYIEKYQNSGAESTIFIAPVNDDTRREINRRKQHIDNIEIT